MTSPARWFLGASFLSTFGDVLVVTAVPFGVGVETGRIEFSVIFWLVPALAVLAASFLGKRVSRRSATARVDYARLLLVIAVVEIVISLLTLQFRGPSATLVLSIIFVALYAFAKEGIPRLLYQVAVYRYFVQASEYARLAGRKAGLDIAAALFATLTAAAVVAGGTWRYVLLFDAVTFVALSVTIWRFGRDEVADQQPLPTAATAPEHDPAARSPDSPVPAELAEPVTTTAPAVPDAARAALRTGLIAVLVAVPLFHGVNAAFVNYLPLINKELSVMTATLSIALLALLRLPGMLLGLAYDRVQRLASPRVWATWLPVVFVLVAFSYLASPNQWSVYGLLLLGGINIGIFGPSDAVIRNQIPGDQLVGYNVLVLRWLGIFQAVSCLGAVAVFTTQGVDTRWLAVLVVAAVVAAAFLPRLHARHVLFAKPAQRAPVTEGAAAA